MSMKSVVSALMVTATGLSIPTSVSAGEIALTLKTQEITLIGEFGGFKGDAYILVTQTGTIYVPAMLVTCEGDDCFEFVNVQSTNS